MLAIVVNVDPFTLRSQQAALEEAGFDVLAAASFADASEQVARCSPDLVVTDVRLRDYNGIHLALRIGVSSPRTRVVVVGYPDRDLEHEASAAGALYLDSAQLSTIVDASARVFDRLIRRRRKHRVRVDGRIEAHAEGVPVRLIDVSEVGFRIEGPAAPPYSAMLTFRIDVPAAGVWIRARPVWSVAGDGCASAVHGASVALGKRATNTRWEHFVAAVAADLEQRDASR
jgi:CheY-like chemotaxis protein